jgi:MFS family permease
MATVFITVAISSYHCMVLEQVPQSRGTTMSLFRAAIGIGCSIAPAIAGGLLILFSSVSIRAGFLAVGVSLCLLNVIAACILYLFTKEHQNK